MSEFSSAEEFASAWAEEWKFPRSCGIAACAGMVNGKLAPVVMKKVLRKTTPPVPTGEGAMWSLGVGFHGARFSKASSAAFIHRANGPSTVVSLSGLALALRGRCSFPKVSCTIPKFSPAPIPPALAPVKTT